jgi:gliding motility-associated-like protein
VQCGETYHIKLAIADGTDTFLESIVVLEAGSFSSNAVALEAEAVPFAADGLEDIVPYADAIGLPNNFIYPNGETFPFSDWYANNNIAVTVDGQSTLVDAIIIEGCNDAQFTVIRSEEEAAETDTLYLNLAGSAQLGLDYAENFNQVVMGPGQVESIVTLGVVDDGFNEGIETAEITYEYINGCGELISTTSLVVIVDPIPIEAIPATVECQTLDGEQELGYTDMVGYGPFNYEWAGDSWGNATMDPSAWTTSFDSVFVMTDNNGQLIDTHVIQLVVTDQCGNSIVHEQEVLYPVIFETEICGGDVQEFPAYNAGIAVSDVLYNGQSLINTTLGSTPLTVDAMAVGDNWLLESISADVVELQWSDTLILVDTCGYVTKAFMRVRDCIIPNVFTPDNSGKNDNFRIRGLDGFAGSKLIVYNRYGTVVYTKETVSDAEFELVWNGNFANGNPAPAGVYQWVLLRADGLKDSGELSLMR